MLIPLVKQTLSRTLIASARMSLASGSNPLFAYQFGLCLIEVHTVVVSTSAQYSSVSLAAYAGKTGGASTFSSSLRSENFSCHIESISLGITAVSISLLSLSVMEALAAISLASNVAQFVEYAIQFTKLAHKFASSDSGPISKHQGIIVITDSMAVAMDEINQHNTDTALNSLTGKCIKVAADVQGIINDLSKKPADTLTRSLHKAGKTLYKQKEIQELSDLLSSMRAQVSQHLLTLIRSVRALSRQFGWR